ncbi:MAG TPA: MBL fold metallo-hydrolase [Planctomycetota bacterium]|nr:MBL fold metallo-hydrolase [Planctomycetota bacterium]HRR82473.1 MBL fold metallo-hydrolase [Planctomycetota bacterium]HRT97202.1 MBL fold metallo-hydrolase [Planctomycetota bacterium]
MSTEITLIGNEGFRIATPAVTLLIDAFYGAIPGLASAPALAAADATRVDLILVTHAHWDHFQADEVAAAARRTGAKVVGPGAVTQALRGAVAPEALVKLEPAAARKGFALSEKVELPGATITAFRTFHAMGHNSYLVETPGFRFFHDGDNEDTRRVDPEALGALDALFIGPWQGSGWVEFVERLAPARWFLMHLSEEELDQHEAGEFLADLCDHVPLPDRLVVLRPGQVFRFS